MRTFLSLVIIFLGCSIHGYSQSLQYSHQLDNSIARPAVHVDSPGHHRSPRRLLPLISTTQDTVAPASDSLPSPNSVMYKSMIIPGWGQITNKQIWKVPIVYGLLGGLAWYSIDLTKRYHDYRAAYYNLNSQTDDDLRFGPTPDYIPENANLEELKSIRNTYRNRRDMVYIGIALAYGLNILDAYVFAHMRSFNVSKDLSMRPSIKPGIMAHSSVGVTLSINLFKNPSK